MTYKLSTLSHSLSLTHAHEKRWRGVLFNEKNLNNFKFILFYFISFLSLSCSLLMTQNCVLHTHTKKIIHRKAMWIVFVFICRSRCWRAAAMCEDGIHYVIFRMKKRRRKMSMGSLLLDLCIGAYSFRMRMFTIHSFLCVHSFLLIVVVVAFFRSHSVWLNIYLLVQHGAWEEIYGVVQKCDNFL
jgi:hypothetical protein